MRMAEAVSAHHDTMEGRLWPSGIFTPSLSRNDVLEGKPLKLERFNSRQADCMPLRMSAQDH